MRHPPTSWRPASQVSFHFSFLTVQRTENPLKIFRCQILFSRSVRQSKTQIIKGELDPVHGENQGLGVPFCVLWQLLVSGSLVWLWKSATCIAVMVPPCCCKREEIEAVTLEHFLLWLMYKQRAWRASWRPYEGIKAEAEFGVWVSLRWQGPEASTLRELTPACWRHLSTFLSSLSTMRPVQYVMLWVGIPIRTRLVHL